MTNKRKVVKVKLKTNTVGFKKLIKSIQVLEDLLRESLGGSVETAYDKCVAIPTLMVVRNVAMLTTNDDPADNELCRIVAEYLILYGQRIEFDFETGVLNKDSYLLQRDLYRVFMMSLVLIGRPVDSRKAYNLQRRVAASARKLVLLYQNLTSTSHIFEMTDRCFYECMCKDYKIQGEMKA